MKKLRKDEINVVVNEVMRQINNEKQKVTEAKLGKDKDYQKLLKIDKELDELNEKVRLLHSSKNDITNSINKKYGCYLYRNRNVGGSGYLSNSNNGDGMLQARLYNRVVLLNIGQGLNIDEMIGKLVTEFK